MTPIIELRGVSKDYDVEPFELRRMLRSSPPVRETPHRAAAADLTLCVEAGERIGIIGRNGAGKTTLLRMLAGVTLPTRGRIRVVGHVASLISLGMGFHPDLSGRENVHLYCALLGWPTDTLAGRVEEILRFADIPGAEDIAFKRYSSGMMARVGFAAAVHVEPDILLLDEVLAVGDYAFQTRSLERIKQLASMCTVIFVSHDLAAIRQLSQRVIWLDQGRIRAEGEPGAMIEAYLRSQTDAI